MVAARKISPSQCFPWRARAGAGSFPYLPLQFFMLQKNSCFSLSSNDVPDLPSGRMDFSKFHVWVPVRAALTCFFPYCSERGLGSFTGSAGSCLYGDLSVSYQLQWWVRLHLESFRRPTKALLFRWGCLIRGVKKRDQKQECLLLPCHPLHSWIFMLFYFNFYALLLLKHCLRSIPVGTGEWMQNPEVSGLGGGGSLWT